jgi:phosphoribosylanthranilate isomerase
MSVRVKICGITNVEDARLAVEAGANLIGLNFYPPSPHCISESTAREIRAALPVTVLSVGVFVNAEREQIATLAERLDLHAVQFHGDETPADCSGWSQKTIKAARINSEDPPLEWEAYPADYILLDAYRPGRYGGTGETFAWEHMANLSVAQRQRIILAGGLTPENVAAAVQAVQPWAVDVASGVESAPGRKDPEKLRAFIHYAKTA